MVSDILILKPFSDSRQAGVRIEKQQFNFYVKHCKNLNENLYESINAGVTELEIFKNHICYQKPPQFYKKKCENCGKDFETIFYEKENKRKPVVYCWTCGSPYCKDKACINQRYLIAKEYYNIFFSAYPSWTTKRGNRWIHESFGFRRQSEPTRTELTLMRYRVFKFLKACEKKFNIKIKGIGVRDLAYDVEKIGEEWFIHFHLARRPTKFIKKSDFNELGEKFNLKYVYHGYKKSNWLAEYFAKRHSGEFEHKQNNSAWMFADIMPIETYFKLYHKSRKFLHYGFTRREVRFLKKRAEELRKCEAFALSSNILPTVEPTGCENCGHTKFKFVLYEENIDITPKPPQNPYKSL